jgi:hypothetical protein
MAYIYQHRRKDTNLIFYIGIAKNSDKKYKRAYSTKKRNAIWNSIVSRFDYNVEIIEDNLTWEEACEKEKFWISFYGRIDLKTGTLANLTSGSEGLHDASDITRDKMRSRMLGSKLSEETKIKMGKSRKGRIVTEETRKKISASNTGKPKSGIPWNKGKSLSEDHIQKLKDNHRDVSGSNNPMYGKPGTRLGVKCSDDTRKKMSQSKLGLNHPLYGKPSPTRKKVKHVETGLIFECQKDAALYFKKSISTISTQVKQGKFITL